ncbi:MAG TPA: glycosyl hydrolase, partial [Armatimonadota bacterium]
MKRLVYLLAHNHFDPTWRRCFDRPAVYNGVTVRGYAEVEAHAINAWLDLAPRGYTFHEGQAVVWRTYLQRHPERKAAVQAYAQSGLLDIILAGETIQDTVLGTAEGLVRNFLVAQPFYRDLVGADHPGLRIATVEDAFGNSPNYPQVLKGVGAEAVGWLSYRTLDEHIWVGIDGTKLPCLDLHPAGHSGAFAKHMPCPDCQGVGCATCAQTGLRFVDGFDLDTLAHSITEALSTHADAPWVAIRFLTEEVRPDARVVDFIEQWNREHADSEIRFSTPLELYRQ